MLHVTPRDRFLQRAIPTRRRRARDAGPGIVERQPARPDGHVRRRHAWHLLLIVAAFLLAGLFATANAQSAPAADDDALAGARDELAQIQQQVGSEGTLETMSALRDRAFAIQTRSEGVADRLTAPLANVEAQLTQLGPAPADAGQEDRAIGDERKSLQADRDRLASQLKLAKLIGVEGAQLVEQIDLSRRTRFAAQLGERTPSVFSPPFWADLSRSWTHDAHRAEALASEVGRAIVGGPAWRWLVVIALWAALMRAVPAMHGGALKVIATRLPVGRIRRSTLAVVRTVLPTFAVWIASRALVWAIDAGSPTPAVTAITSTLANAMTFAAFIGAMGRALAAPNNPSWRLPDALPDPVALALRNGPLYLGGVISIGMVLDRISGLVSTSLSTTVSINALSAIASGVVLVLIAHRGERARRAMVEGSGDAPRRSAFAKVLVVGAWGMLAASLLCLTLGYVALGRLLVGQFVWISLVGMTAYLVFCLVDDACSAWLVEQETGDAANQVEMKPSARRQAAILTSGVTRVVLCVLAITLMFAPLGQDAGQLLQRAEGLSDGIMIGEIRILPGSVVQALIILIAGILAVRALRRWLLDRYLPTTSMDTGMRASTATLLGYVGFVVAGALALSALGIGIERVAWIASALSVGIGFGLQAIVQNFVSGLILLTERPVKVGDWVGLGDVEGDVRRISVRATEIQMGDRSTVIVPNSEFITKVVRNVTMGSPMGLVVIKVPLPLDADVVRARELMLEAFATHDGIVDAPAPAVVLDAIANDRLMMVGSGSTGSPRQAGGVRSALLFDVLDRFRQSGIALAPRPA